MNTSNKRVKIDASFPGFYLTFLTPRLARLSLLTPCLTLARASQQILAFPPYGRRVSPIQAASFHLQSGDGESPPARQPYLFHPTADLPFGLYLSDTASLDLRRTPARASRPDNLTFSNLLPQRGSPVRHGDLETSRTSTRASQTTTSPFLARRGLPVRHGDLETSRTST